MTAISLALVNYTCASASGCQKPKWIRVIFRIIVILLIILGVSVIASISSKSSFCIPGMIITITFYTDSVYASPLLVLPLSFLIVISALCIFRSKSNENSNKARRARAFAVAILLLLPLVPYAVVEGQTLLFARDFAKIAGQDRLKVMSISPYNAVIAIENFPRDVYFLKRFDGSWHVERRIWIKGEYIGVFPPYTQLDW